MGFCKFVHFLFNYRINLFDFYGNRSFYFDNLSSYTHDYRFHFSPELHTVM